MILFPFGHPSPRLLAEGKACGNPRIAAKLDIPYTPIHYGACDNEQGKIIARVRRIAGQVAAIERSVTADADCAETLHLVAAVRGAVAGLMDELVEDHLHAHVAAPVSPMPSATPPPPSWPSCSAVIFADLESLRTTS